MSTHWYHLPIALCFFLPFQIFYRTFCLLCGLVYFLLFCFRTCYAKNSQPILITIRFSHYCEKARWALDLLQDAAAHHLINEGDSTTKLTNSYKYTERARSVLTHMVTSLWYTNGLSSSTPIYVTADKRVLKDSSHIMRYVSDELCALGKPTLYPNSEVSVLEDYFNEILGVHARRYAYWSMFQSDAMENELKECWLRGTVGWERWIQRHFFGPIKSLLIQGMNIKQLPSLESKQQVDNVFEKVNRMFDEHDGLYLLNTNYPTAADITFAALAYPMIFPPQCDELVTKYDLTKVNREFYDQITSYRSQKAGKFVLRMYEQHRLMKKINPNNLTSA